MSQLELNHKITGKDFEEWLNMALDLWPTHSRDELRKELENIFNSPRQGTFIANVGDNYAGFINMSLRVEYVSGASSYPVGYVEGIYVKPEYRRQGIAGKLLECGEKWALEKGCKELGSDTWLWNKDSQEFHKRVGFKETEIIVHFIKKINDYFTGA